MYCTKIKKGSFLFLFASALLLIFLLKTSTVHAATLFLSPKATEIKVGETFNLEMRVNSEDQGFNATQSTIQFPTNILEVLSIDYSPATSIFNFWLEEPTFSNEEGRITFIGGTTGGVTGASVRIIKITFKAKGSGEGDITLNDAAVIASDGNGTNILSTTENASFRSIPIILKPELPGPTTESPSTPPIVSKPLEIAPPTPTPIVREPTIVKQLPEAPVISVPLYSDQEKWYNFTTNFLVQWSLPEDISDVSTALNQNPTFEPTTKSEGLFDAKIFPALTGDGIWYLHVRFKNNVGWGPTIHYKLAIDTIPPLAFDIKVLEGLVTDIPKPTLEFETSDGLSGIQNYFMRVDNNDLIFIENGTTLMSLQDPGVHTINIKAQDFAGNTRESNIEIEILPIESPIISFISEDVYVDENDLIISGTSLPNIRVILSLVNKYGIIQDEITSQSNMDGVWTAKFEGPFKKGEYLVKVLSQDGRGAKSLTIESKLFKIKPKPIFTLGTIQITQFWFFSILILFTIGIFITGWFSYYFWRKRKERNIFIAQRDLTNTFNNTIKEITRILQMFKKTSIEGTCDEEAIKFLLRDIQIYLEKGKKYINEHLDEVNK